MVPGIAKQQGVADFGTANAGETPAEIISYIATGYIQEVESAFLPLLHHRGVRKYPKRLTIQPGESILIRAEFQNIGLEYERWTVEGGTMFVLGEITYKGRDNVKRITGFCRVYDPSDGIWKPMNNPAYEYS